MELKSTYGQRLFFAVIHGRKADEGRVEEKGRVKTHKRGAEGEEIFSEIFIEEKES